MENRNAAILVLAILAAVVITASGAYAMGMRAAGTGSTYPGTTYGSGTGPWMMGGSAWHAGGMMRGYAGYPGMMGNGDYSMYQYMAHYWNSTATS